MTTAADSLPNFTDCIVDKRYKLVKLLGSGAYGVVYKALDLRKSSKSRPRYRAMKIIKKAGREPADLAVIRREVALHSVVSHHPNIVGLHDAYDDSEFFYIILDYCDGGDLFEHICDKEAYLYNDDLVRSAFLSLIDAVQACHDARIAHRDLKPENVLMNEDGSKAYLADFGLATDKRMIDDYGCGTHIYMAPECFGPDPYCARASDVWALGVILINMVSCINPWSKASLKDQCFRRFVNDPDYLYDALPISKAAHTILMQILAINPLRRVTLPKLRQMIMTIDTFFRPMDGSKATKQEIEPPSIAVKPHSTDGSIVDELRLSKLTLAKHRSLSSNISPTSSISSVPSLSSDDSTEDWEDENTDSIVISPDETSSWTTTGTKGMEEFDWKEGSMAQMIISQYRRDSDYVV